MRRTDLLQRGGKGLFKGRSFPEVLKAVYPQHPWDTLRFAAESRAPVGCWESDTNLLQALDKIANRMGIIYVSSSPLVMT